MGRVRETHRERDSSVVSPVNDLSVLKDEFKKETERNRESRK